MDLNIYNIYFVYELLGKPVSFNYDYQKHINGIDLSGQFEMKYDEALATCFSAKNCHGKPYAFIHGTEGYIEISNGVNGLKNFNVTIQNNIENYNIQNNKNHFIYEIMEFKRIISENDLGKAELLNAKTQYIMELLTDARYKAGLFFKNDIDIKFQE
jgi:predicted dehydrogenase